jgi:hypothetical protein
MAQIILAVNAAPKGIKEILPVERPSDGSARSRWPSLCGRRHHRQNLACTPRRAPMALTASADQRDFYTVASEELEYTPAMGGIQLLEVMQIGVLSDTSKAKEEHMLPYALNIAPGEMSGWRTVSKPADRRVDWLIMDVAVAAQ